MIYTITIISSYLIVAIALGYLFGWLITKSIWKEKYLALLEKNRTQQPPLTVDIKQKEEELAHYRKINEKLIEENTELKLNYQGQKFVLDEHNSELDKFQELLKSKDDVIEKLTTQLSNLEDRQMAMQKKYDSEIEAFLFERVDITQKYRELLERLKQSKEGKALATHNSWFSNLFSKS